MDKAVVVLRPTQPAQPAPPAPSTAIVVSKPTSSAIVGFRNKNILPNKHHDQSKEIINTTYLRHTRGDEPEVVKAKIKDPNYKAPPDVNPSLPKFIPQVRPPPLNKNLTGASGRLENLIAGQNKNPYTLVKMWNLGYMDDVNPNLFLGREYTLQLMKEAGVEPYEETQQEETQQPEPKRVVVVKRPEPTAQEKKEPEIVESSSFRSKEYKKPGPKPKPTQKPEVILEFAPEGFVE